MSTNPDPKKAAGFTLVDQELAAGHLRSGTASTPFRVGLGTGSTAIWAIRRLAEHVQAGTLNNLVCIPTSLGSHIEAQKLGLSVTDLNDPRVLGRVDWAFDGADQVSPAFHLIKGGGAAHTREKLVEYNAARFVVLVDERKMVHRLGGDPSLPPGTKVGTCDCPDGAVWQGNAFAVPVECVPLAVTSVSQALESYGARTKLRESAGKVGPVVTDNSCYIVDAVFPEGLVPMTNTDPTALEMAITMIPGVLEVGLFTCPVAAVYVGKQDGTVETLLPEVFEPVR